MKTFKKKIILCLALVMILNILGGAIPTVYANSNETGDYDLRVGGVYVTKENRDDILGDGGSVKFSPKSRTLTLTNATIDTDKTGVYSFGSILSGNNNLTIILNGNNVFNVDSTKSASGISGEELDLTITGSGRLDINLSSTDISTGIFALKTKIQSTKVYINDKRTNNYFTGIYSKDMNINKSVLKMKGYSSKKEFKGITSEIYLADGSLNIINSEVSIDSGYSTGVSDGIILKYKENTIARDSNIHIDLSKSNNGGIGIWSEYTMWGGKLVILGPRTSPGSDGGYAFRITRNFVLVDEPYVAFKGDPYVKEIKDDSHRFDYYNFENVEKFVSKEYDGKLEKFEGKMSDIFHRDNYQYMIIGNDKDRPTFKVTYDPNFGTGEMEPGEFLYETDTTLPNNKFTPPEGHEFDYWQIGRKNLKPGDTINVVSDLVVKAIWKPAKYTISFDKGAGIGQMPSVKHTYGEEYTLPENGFSPYPGKVFGSWKIGKTNYQPGDKIKILGDTTVRAIWVDHELTMKYLPGEGKGEPYSDTGFLYGQTFPLLYPSTFTAPEGKVFSGWLIHGERYELEDFTIRRDTEAIAIWEKHEPSSDAYVSNIKIKNGDEEVELTPEFNQYRLNYTAYVPLEVKNLKANINPNTTYSEVFFNGNEIELSDVSESILNDLKEGENNLVITVTANDGVTKKTYTVKIMRGVTAPETYKLSFDPNGGSGTIDDIEVEKGEKANLPENTFTPPSGLSFFGWESDGYPLLAPNSPVIITKDTTFKAKWVKFWNLKYDANGGGGSVPLEVAVDGNTHTLLEGETFTPPTDKTFSHWEINGDSTPRNPGYELFINSDNTIKAIWKDRETYNVSFNPNGGSGEMATQDVQKNGTYTLPANYFNPPTGMTFKAWEVNGEEKFMGDSITVTSDIEVKAIWKTKEDTKFEITFNSNGGSGEMGKIIVADGDNTYLPECSFTPPNGKIFKAWLLHGKERAAGFTFSVYKNEEVKAIWEDSSSGTSPTITTATLADGEVELGYSAVINATGDTPINWTLESGDLPDGLTLFQNYISGSPTKEGTFTFELKATNTFGSDTKEFSIKIGPKAEHPAYPIIITKELPNGIVGNSYNVKLAATGDEPITWNIIAGSLPDGLTLSGSTISGTPSKQGTFEFVALATNDEGTYAKALTIKINPKSTPVLVAPSITTSTLPKGEVNKQYKATLFATGNEPITWSVESGQLPDGLTLNGNEISGIPTKTGNFNFTIKATNAYGVDLKNYVITVEEKVEEKVESSPIDPSFILFPAHGIKSTASSKPNIPTPIHESDITLQIRLIIGSKILEKSIDGLSTNIEMDVAPYIVQGRTMVPIRFVAEALGFDVNWNQDTWTVIMKDKYNTVEIPVLTNKIIVNGNVYESDVAPILENGRTFLPIGNVARALGLKDGKDVIWKGETQEVIIKRTIEVK